MKMASPSQTSKKMAFVVKRCVPELVVPVKPTPQELKKVSDIDDQKILRDHFPVIWFYRKNDKNPSMEEGKEKDPAKVIKEALGRTLVYYYPLAGRLKEGLDGKLFVDCNGEGILFIEADAYASFEQLGHPIQPPFPYIDEILYDVPPSYGFLDCPLLLIQVTRMSCGSFILAVNFNHVMFDGFGLSQFMNTLGEIAQGAKNPTIPPVWQRELLNARNPPRITQIHHEYLQEATDIDHPNFDNQTDNVNHSFFFGPNQIMAIRNHLPPHLANCTTRFELLTACIWKCRTLALNLNPEEDVQVSCVFNRQFNNIKNDLNLPLGYYSNVIAYSAALSKAGVLCEKPLEYAVELVKIAKSKMNAEHIRSAADFMVIKRRPGFKLEGNYVISDLTRLGFEDVDFGCGLPEYAAPPMVSKYLVYNVKHKSKGEDGILVLICLPLLVMERFQQELSKIITKKDLI